MKELVVIIYDGELEFLLLENYYFRKNNDIVYLENSLWFFNNLV